MTNALKITIFTEVGGKAAVANFQTRCGLLADTSLGDKDAFNCVEHRGGVELRWFRVAPGMNIRALTDPVQIAPGLTAQVVPASEAPPSVPLSGPGSTLMLQMRQSHGFNSGLLPTLPHAWAMAIDEAACLPIAPAVRAQATTELSLTASMNARAAAEPSASVSVEDILAMRLPGLRKP